MDSKKRRRPWFDVAKALHKHLGISLGRAALFVAWVRYAWCMLTTRDLPPQWLFVVGAWFVTFFTWMRMRFLRWQGKRKGVEMEHERFMSRCVFWSQIAVAVMLTEQFSPGGCDRMGSLAGRLVRYSRTFDPANTYDLEMAEDAIYQVEREFVKMPISNQEMAINSLKMVVRMVDSKASASFMDAIEGEEKRIKSKREQTN